MTPLIDITLLLIIFFMLISNFLAEEAVEMVVPRLAEPATRRMADVPQIIVNVAPQPFEPGQRGDDPLAWSGEASMVKVGTVTLASSHLHALTALLRDEAARAPKDADGRSRLEIILRADAALHYEQMQPVMSAVSAAGVVKVHLTANLPEGLP